MPGAGWTLSTDSYDSHYTRHAYVGNGYLSQRVGAVRVTLTPHWAGDATVTDVLDGAGARRLVQKGGGKVASTPGTTDVTFATQTLGTARALASTLTTGSGVQPTSREISPNAKNLTVRDAVSFPVKAGASYELSKFVGVDSALTTGDPEASAIGASTTAAAAGSTSCSAHTPPPGRTCGAATSRSPASPRCRTGCAPTSTRCGRASARAPTTASPPSA